MPLFLSPLPQRYTAARHLFRWRSNHLHPQLLQGSRFARGRTTRCGRSEGHGGHCGDGGSCWYSVMPRVSIKTYLVSFEIMRDICAYHPKLTPYRSFPSLLRVGHKQSDKMFGLFNGECLNMVSLLIFLHKCWI